ncbi:MAG: hypothetical protein JSW49_04670 [candidate division WOR-3 bacterium]|nr:MAG: hypothetical protein JSW49_04670 [candidate division WOR-3 bacterium]
MRFPLGRPIIENTRLEFINLNNVLTASKRERAHRIVGYIAIYYHDISELIFLNQGEPFNAARITPERREIVPIGEIVDKAKKATSGTLSEYATDEILLRLMISSVTLKPLKSSVDLTRIQPKIFIEKLKSSKFNGFIWVRTGLDESYVYFSKGAIPGCYIAGREDLEPEEAIYPILARTEAKVAIFDHVGKVIDEQATPAQVEMFCKIFTALLKAYAHPLGQSLVLRTALVSKNTAQKEFPFISKFDVDSDLTFRGEVVVEPKAFAQGMARMFDLIYESFSTFLGKESELIARKILTDYRFALKTLQFFDFTKLKI